MLKPVQPESFKTSTPNWFEHRSSDCLELCVVWFIVVKLDSTSIFITPGSLKLLFSSLTLLKCCQFSSVLTALMSFLVISAGSICQWGILLAAAVVHREQRSSLCSHVFSIISPHNSHRLGYLVGRVALPWKVCIFKENTLGFLFFSALWWICHCEI